MKITNNYYRGIIKTHANPQPIKVDVRAPSKSIAMKIVEQKYQYQISYWIKPLEQLPF